jgi:hypothetical protein
VNEAATSIPGRLGGSAGGQGIANLAHVVKLDLGVRKLIAQRLAKRFEKHTFGYR